MSRHAHDNKVIDALTRPPADPASIEPPADLAERIKADVPPALELVPELAGDGSSTGRRRVWLAAASVLLAVGAGVVALQVRDRTESEAISRGALDARSATGPEATADSSPTGRPDRRVDAGGAGTGRQPRAHSASARRRRGDGGG